MWEDPSKPRRPNGDREREREKKRERERKREKGRKKKGKKILLQSLEAEVSSRCCFGVGGAL